MPEPPQTAEGWYVLHDFRSVDWDAWRAATERERRAAVEEGVEYAASRRDERGESAVFSVVGHDADLLFLHFRPAVTDLDRVQRRFEATAFADVTERADSYVSVTEVSGYVSREYFEGGEVDDGLESYIEGKLHPEIPDGYLCFYPMSKRREAGANWYTLDFEERAELMADHGDVGRRHAENIRQVISSSVGLDDWEWAVTLFSDDPTAIKDVVYDMRFDEASARYADFGEFLLARRFPPEDLEAFLAGETVPTDADDESEDRTESAGDAGAEDGPPVREELADLDVYGGQPHGEDVHARVVYSSADPDELAAAVDDLRESFDHYGTHVGTDVYENPDGGHAAVVSRWETDDAADVAAGFLGDLPGVESEGPAPGDGGGWGTMGMFYTVKPEHRESFVEKFATVEELLADTDGHRRTELLVNRADENDMFVASRWCAREDAMEFFRSDAFTETVSWGRDVLDDRPRHVFLD